MTNAVSQDSSKFPPVPDHLRDSLRVFWYFSHWCNYQCDNCGVPVFGKRSKDGSRQMHAFDYYSPEEWLAALDKFPRNEIALVISGGEPLLDRLRATLPTLTLQVV